MGGGGVGFSRQLELIGLCSHPTNYFVHNGRPVEIILYSRKKHFAYIIYTFFFFLNQAPSSCCDMIAPKDFFFQLILAF